MINIDSVAQLARGLSAKKEKQDGKGEVVVCTIKLVDAFITREQLDAFCEQPLGWHQFLFDDQGAPRLRLGLQLIGADWSVTGTIKGNADVTPPTLNLLQAKLSGVVITLTQLGAVLAGDLSWTARGDEVEDLTDLLGALVKITWRVTNGEQGDLLRGIAIGASLARAADAGEGAETQLRERLRANSKSSRRSRAASADA